MCALALSVPPLTDSRSANCGFQQETALSAAHYLSDLREHFIAQGGEAPGRLVGPGARQYDEKEKAFWKRDPYPTDNQKGSPRARLGGPKVLVL